MSEWITDRLPEYEEGFSGLVWSQVKKGTPCLRRRSEIKLGMPWMEISPPKPYVKPEPQRWKPQNESLIYYISLSGDTNFAHYYDHADARRAYDFGNVFQNLEQAEEAARRIHELLLNYHKELLNGQMDNR